MCGSFVSALLVTGASISVFDRDGHQSTICTSDAVAARGDTLQLELGEGPHWDALAAGTAVLGPNLAHPNEARWPMFSSAALELGMAAVFAFPMRMGAVTVGVVDLYSDTPKRLDTNQIALASSMAGRSAVRAVRQAMRSAENPNSDENPSAPAIRREVHQATGIIQVQLNVGATEAFARLRAYSFMSNRPVGEVAHDVVTRQIDFRTHRD
jgi:ANTAR domain/GAF domain